MGAKKTEERQILRETVLTCAMRAVFPAISAIPSDPTSDRPNNNAAVPNPARDDSGDGRMTVAMTVLSLAFRGR